MKSIVYFIVVMFSFVTVEAQEDLKGWTDVVVDSRNPADWKWNKTESSRFMIRGDFDGDGFEENLYETATKLYSDNKEITDLQLDGDLGVYFLVNEGDLDGDGGDEISFMVVNRDFSNINSFRVWTYTGERWKELFQIPVREWDCPNYKPQKQEEMFTYQWKRKNGYNMNKIILNVQDGAVDVIGIHPNGRYAIEHIKIVKKFPVKREWGTIIQPRND
ncbi:MAG: hypothetical protein LBR28_02300 [Bacteroidales bacterium]|jgi:hypothetical protein|nr:hypothetical protein [Bacteroidales bacterium]